MEMRLVTVDDAKSLAEFYAKNRNHLAAWEPAREDEFYSEDFWKQRLAIWIDDTRNGRAAHYVSVDKPQSRVVAVCSLTNIARGPFQACNIGYAVSLDVQGTGQMTTLVSHVVNAAFNELGLNRVMANYMPSNVRSAKLLQKLGFVEEGIAKKYLLINGIWEDHVLTSLVNPNNV